MFIVTQKYNFKYLGFDFNDDFEPLLKTVC